MKERKAEAMRAYVLKVAGVMLLLSVTEAILPAGNMRSAAKRVFALIRIAVLVEPAAVFISGAGIV